MKEIKFVDEEGVCKTVTANGVLGGVSNTQTIINSGDFVLLIRRTKENTFSINEWGKDGIIIVLPTKEKAMSYIITCYC